MGTRPSKKIRAVFKSRMERGLRCSGSVCYGYVADPIQIYFSETSKDSFSDKLLRLIKNDIANKSKGA